MALMLLRKLAPPGAVLVALLAAGARGEIVEGIYTARIDLDDRSVASLASARSEGLARVLIKASGDATAPERPAAATALGAAERYLLSYSFEESPDEQGLRVRLDYDERAVQNLLRESQLPLWTANRPPVVAWVVLRDAGGRRFLNPAELPEAGDMLTRSFDERGIPLQMPLFDLADTAALSPGEAWRLSSPALLEAARRYRGSELLAGRVAPTSDGRWVGDWRLLYGGRWLSRAVDAGSFAAFTDAGADLVAATVAARYAVNLADNMDRRHRVTLRGVLSYRDYLAAQETLEALETVRRVVPEALLGDQVTLRIEADADPVQLARIIELDRRFVATPAAPGETGLHYEWIR
jgi:hypothetical protein